VLGQPGIHHTPVARQQVAGRAITLIDLPVPTRLADIGKRCGVDVQKLPRAIERLGDIDATKLPAQGLLYLPHPYVVPGGFFKCGDPWHSQTNEVQWVHAIGWKVAVPSNAEDAVGLLRAALRGNDPVVFFEHRAMLDHV
jgi:hypothetical protein